MATDPGIISLIVDQMSQAGDVSAKPMFGEYGIYCDGKMVAIVGDGQLFLKLTNGGRAFAHDAVEASPYPGAKPCLLIPAERWDDRDWLSELIRISAAELPMPRRKPSKKV